MGLIIGARLGYVLFYNLPFYWQHPLAIVSPFDPMNHEFIGIYGMSYHGGLIGAILASALFAKKYRVNFWRLANFTTPAIPAGYFFGRLGNFLNGELYGRITSSAWGMYFSNAIAADGFSSPQLRHPSQLYEAFLEGFVLFAILWPLRNNPKYEDKLYGLYLCGYASARILAEFFRQPDSQIGFLFGFMTLGQLISLIMFVSGLIVIGMEKKQEQC
jgi:phosphatidylglycerol:prolipoprotein diacylglycerol transferase